MFYGERTRAGTWHAARTGAGAPSMHFHDLRTQAPPSWPSWALGATEAEVQAFLGDSTPAAAQRYVRAAQSRMKKLADRMSELAASGDW